MRPGRWTTLLVAVPMLGAGLQLAAAPASAACSLSVSGIAPAAGFTGGGTTSTITGCDFQAGTMSVSYGGAAGTSVAVASDTSLTVKSPAHAAGAVTVTVTLTPSSGSPTTATTAFTYVDPPTLATLIPTSGPEKGGTAVRLTGTHLAPSVGTVGVTFGSADATGVTSTDTTVAGTSPAGTGTVDVKAVVTLPGGEKATSSALSYRYVPAPVVTSVSPASGPPTGGSDVTITGTGFQPGATVLFGPSDGSAVTSGSQFPGDVSASPVSVLSATSILATTRAGTPGATNLVVLNPDGQYGALTATATGHYTFTAGTPPVVSTVAPTSGTSLGGTRVTVTGTGFARNAGVTFGSAGQSNPPAGTATIVSADGTSLSTSAPAHAGGVVDVVVTNPADSQRSTSVGAFTYTAAAAPVLTGASAASGTSLGGATMTLTGTGFAAGATVSFGGTPAPRAAVVSATSITLTTPARAAGSAPIVVSNADGQASAALAYTVTAAAAPTISAITPTTGSGGTEIRLTGTGFATTNGSAANSAAAAVVSVGPLACTPGTSTATAGCLGSVPPATAGTAPAPIVLSSTSIDGIVPFGPGGSRTVTVKNPDGQVATTTFTDTASTGTPTLTAISPTSGSTLGGTSVTLTGTNLLPGAVVRFGPNSQAVPGSVVVAAGGTSLTARTPAGVYGTVDVSVTNPGASTPVTLTYVFTFTAAAAPTITSVSPTSGISGTTVTITGTGFANRNGTSTNATNAAAVTVGGLTLLPVDATTPVVVSDTSIRGLIPTSGATGAVDVAVTNPDGQGAISVGGFSYPTDTTAPTTTATGASGGSAYTFGSWARNAVAVTLTPDDNGGSGVASVTYSATGAQPVATTTVPLSATTPSATVSITRDGVTALSFAALDVAGNAETSQSRTIKVDRTAPALATAATVPTAGGTAPYVSGQVTSADVTVTFTCSDGGSGVATVTSSAGSATTTTSGSNPLAVTVSSAGSAQAVTGTCTDVAGNSTSTTFSGITIVRTAPAISVAATAADGTAYTAGTWTNGTVTVSFSCVPIDKDNSVDSITNPVQVDGPVLNGTVSGSCTDAAGNTATTTFGAADLGIDIDRTLPVAAASATTTDAAGHTVAYSAGTWTAHDVVVTFTCTDPGTVVSGVASVDPAAQVVAEGTTSGVVGGCRDVAGNAANPPAFFGPVLIDRTAPTSSVTVAPNPLLPSSGKLIAVTASVVTTDALSGPGGKVLVSVTSNNPATASSDIVGFTPGTDSTRGQLRATKGRAYTFTYRTSDVAGNTSVCSVVVRAG